MKSYVALLRGIAPTNPNMRNDRLRGVFAELGFSNVRTVISSGNVLFETDSSAVRALETKVERRRCPSAWDSRAQRSSAPERRSKLSWTKAHSGGWTTRARPT
jgi:hypothetical protein